MKHKCFIKDKNWYEFRVLEAKGKISKKQADQKALAEYGEFNKTQKLESGFDKMTKELLRGNRKD
jgi:hypothetical protein